MREDFCESHSTFPLGSCEYIGCGGVGCYIRFGVNESVKRRLRTNLSRLHVQVDLLSIVKHIHYVITDNLFGNEIM